MNCDVLSYSQMRVLLLILGAAVLGVYSDDHLKGELYLNWSYRCSMFYGDLGDLSFTTIRPRGKCHLFLGTQAPYYCYIGMRMRSF